MQTVPKLSALIVLLTGLLALCGKLYFPAILERDFSGLAAMPGPAAVGFVLIGFAMRLARWEGISRWARRQVQAFRLLIFAQAAFMLGEYLGVSAQGNSHVVPLPTAISFVFLSLTLLLLSWQRSFFICQTLLFMSALTQILAFTGGIYDADTSHGAASVFAIDWVSLVLLFMSTVGLLYSNTHRGLMAIVTSETVAGAQARLLLPASIVIPILLGWVRLSLENRGMLTTKMGMVLHVVLTIVLLALVVAWDVAALVRATTKTDEIEQVLRETELAYRAVLSRSSQAICISDIRGNLQYMNHASEWLCGCKGADAHGVNIYTLLTPAGDEECDVFGDLIAGYSHPKLMNLRTGGGNAIEVFVSTITRYRMGDPVAVLLMIEPVESVAEQLTQCTFTGRLCSEFRSV